MESLKRTFLKTLCVLSGFTGGRFFAIPWTVAHQAPLPIEFSRQEYWSGLPCLFQGYLPNPGIETVSIMSPALTHMVFTTSITWGEKDTMIYLKASHLLGGWDVWKTWFMKKNPIYLPAYIFRIIKIFSFVWCILQKICHIYSCWVLKISLFNKWRTEVSRSLCKYGKRIHF